MVGYNKTLKKKKSFEFRLCSRNQNFNLNLKHQTLFLSFGFDLEIEFFFFPFLEVAAFAKNVRGWMKQRKNKEQYCAVNDCAFARDVGAFQLSPLQCATLVLLLLCASTFRISCFTACVRGRACVREEHV